MGSRTRTRQWLSPSVHGRKRNSILSPWTSYSSLGHLSTETITDETNVRLHGGRWSGGGAMILSRQTIDQNPPQYPIHFITDAAGNVTREGTVLMLNNTAGVTDISGMTPDSEATRMVMGTKAIANSLPTNPAFDLSTALGEIFREGIPRLPGLEMMEQTRKAKALGSEHLNLEFGWLPLVRSVKDFAGAVNNSDEILRGYQEQANIPVNVRYEFPEESASKYTPSGFATTNAMGIFSKGGRFQTKFKRTWFEAEYVFHIPTGGSMSDKMRRFGSKARKLYGTELTPETLWNLAPWSWAGDWATNMGDVLHNLSAFGQDGLVMRHAYLMQHVRLEMRDYGEIDGLGCTRTIVKETKSRIPATPYGFGVSYDGLTLRQKAILAALGLSRW